MAPCAPQAWTASLEVQRRSDPYPYNHNQHPGQDRAPFERGARFNVRLLSRLASRSLGAVELRVRQLGSHAGTAPVRNRRRVR